MSNQFEQETARSQGTTANLNTGTGVDRNTLSVKDAIDLILKNEDLLNQTELLRELINLYDTDPRTHNNQDFHDAVLTVISMDPIIEESPQWGKVGNVIHIMKKNGENVDDIYSTYDNVVYLDDCINSILEEKDPLTQIELLTDLYEKLYDPLEGYAVPIHNEPSFDDAVDSILLKNPIVPGSPLHQAAINLCNINEYGHRALTSAELAGALFELKDLKSKEEFASDDFIEEVTKCICYTIEHNETILPKHELLAETDYELSNILSLMDDRKSREKIYTSMVKSGIGIFMTSGTLLRKDWDYLCVTDDPRDNVIHEDSRNFLGEYTKEFFNSTPFKAMICNELLRTAEFRDLSEYLKTVKETTKQLMELGVNGFVMD